MEAYLEVTTENVDELNDLGITCKDGDELTCDVTYDINRADPDVGIMSDDFQITSVTYDGTDVTHFFDEDKLTEEAAEDRELMQPDEYWDR